MGLALCLGRLHLELGTLLQGRVPFRHVPEARSADAIYIITLSVKSPTVMNDMLGKCWVACISSSAHCCRGAFPSGMCQRPAPLTPSAVQILNSIRCRSPSHC